MLLGDLRAWALLGVEGGGTLIVVSEGVSSGATVWRWGVLCTLREYLTSLAIHDLSPCPVARRFNLQVLMRMTPVLCLRTLPL